jgi:hypothetical protein
MDFSLVTRDLSRCSDSTGSDRVIRTVIVGSTARAPLWPRWAVGGSIRGRDEIFLLLFLGSSVLARGANEPGIAGAGVGLFPRGEI